jgi:ribosomal protein S24E
MNDGYEDVLEAIASDSDIDIAFVISPSAANLTGGEYANPNLHILTSTKVMNEAIKDVILVRKDWAQKHKQELKKIRDSYLKSRSKIMDTELIKKYFGHQIISVLA